MKHLFRFAAFALLVCAAGLHAQTTPPASTDHTFTVNWSLITGYPPCSATVTKACIWGYTETITSPLSPTDQSVIPSCSATVTTNCLGPTSSTFAYTPGGLLYCGTWTGSLVTNYLDGNGNAAVSTPPGTVTAVATCPFVPPGSPKNPTASFQ